MGNSGSKKSAIRMLIALIVVFAILVGTLIGGIYTKKAPRYPNLALDLEGGIQLILTPKATADKGARKIEESDINEAIDVIRQRVDASGVAEAEITALGAENISVSLPGKLADQEATIDLVRQSAQMVFRPVLTVGAPQSEAANLAQADEKDIPKEASEEEKAQLKKGIEAAKQDPEAYAKAQADANGDGKLSDKPANPPADNSDLAWVTEKVNYDFLTLDCTNEKNRVGGDNGDPKKAVVSCAKDGTAKYILGPVEIEGSMIESASSGMQQTQGGGTTGQWVVDLAFNSTGAKKFSDVSTRLYSYRNSANTQGTDEQQQEGAPAPGGDDPRNRFAIVLDGVVISAPGIENPINNGKAQIHGGFTKSSAATLANQLQFGSLPLNFELQSQQQVSATLGSDQLYWGFIAGLIGLILIVLFMIWTYRGLSIISVGSLFVAAAIAYVTISLLSWWMGYRLSLAGIAGLIISIGTTADSFIVYFERIRDEVRDGRPLVSAVDEGWERAKRTIVSADFMNLIAAGVLYFLAVGNVQGFAFTLGVMTIIDLIVIFFFTHPMMVMFIRIPFFGEGHKLSGLDPEHLGATTRTYRYKGRGRVERDKPVSGTISLSKKKDDEDAATDESDTKERSDA